MPDRTPEDPRAVRNRLIWEDAFAWIGRIFATMVFMVGPALIGLWLDRQLGTKFLAAIGIIVGMGLGITALLILVNVKRPSLNEEASGRSGATRDDRIDDDQAT
jgi:F0F1-type ATP synthase assembly protein I